jgi:ketosteroid isomerase-like protein
MSHETNKEIARRFGQVWGRGDPCILDELASPEIEVFYPGLPAPIRGVEAFKRLLARVHAGLHDADCEFGDLVAEGEVVVGPWTLRGTQRHSQNVRAKPRVALSIYDCTHVPLRGQPTALYG